MVGVVIVVVAVLVVVVVIGVDVVKRGVPRAATRRKCMVIPIGTEASSPTQNCRQRSFMLSCCAAQANVAARRARISSSDENGGRGGAQTAFAFGFGFGFGKGLGLGLGVLHLSFPPLTVLPIPVHRSGVGGRGVAVRSGHRALGPTVTAVF